MTSRAEGWGKEGGADLQSPLESLRGIGPKRAAALAEAGIRTVEDLLWTLPFRYEDRSRFTPISDLAPGLRATVRGRIASCALRRTRVRGFTLLHVTLEDESGVLPCLWYNQPYLKNVLKEGRSAVFFGGAVLPPRGRPEIRFVNPQFEILGKDPEGIHTGRIVPVYRKLGDLSSRRLRGILHRLLKAIPPDLPDPLPKGAAQRRGLPPRAAAFRSAHFPPKGTSLALLESGETSAHRRLAFEELYTLQAGLARSRRARRAVAGLPCRIGPEIRNLQSRILPFRLTGAQEKALAEIEGDLCASWPMGRLLQGDVGSGKTVVALLAALAVMGNDRQVALMVPTEILAEQHARSFDRLLAGTPYRRALLTGETPPALRREILEGIEAGSVHLVVGTHALIQEGISFGRLGLVIVDEQHRFGVRQRSRLLEKGGNPHLLLMTATPIPRSLALTYYGDLEVSVLDESPAGRGEQRTVLRRDADRERIYAFIRREAAEGKKTVIVYPLVEGAEGKDLRSAVEAAGALAAGPLSAMELGLLHGRLAPDKRRAVMAAFASGEIRVLVTTTVVEVGIDVPEATVMVVEHPERFGLSQLHQLRGRVGRGPFPSWCILLPGESIPAEAEARLKILCETRDGFEIARKDLELRGPGELRGLRQSGDTGLRVARLDRDLELLEQAREEAGRTDGSPPRLASGRTSASRRLPGHSPS